MEEWRIEEEVIIAINHSCVDGEDQVSLQPRAFLLLGDREKALLQNPVPIDFNAQSHTGKLDWDVDLVRERVRLLQVMHSLQQPLVLLVVDKELYDYTDLVEEISVHWPPECVLSYQLDKCVLQCWDTALYREIGHVVVEQSLSGYLPNNGIKTNGVDEPLHFQEQSQLVKKLIQKIDHIINHLQNATSSELLDEILRQCWLLVCRLRLPPTEDIERDILTLDIQWQLIQTLTTQVETALNFA
ncbi:HDR100Wp [Eremothecium sinecaudum]|uniref:HDR100Wp n=1 Tax=Eremothecium sinecaudum TaxID=45286 RepID=A0A0X8HSS4_9SACH|nr:HDR100Wp [Eremothecium sinecaudum]AMD20842.1 HDR100Wp [Eremothecium sinecaudum]